MILRKIYLLLAACLLLTSCNGKFDLSDSNTAAYPLEITTGSGDMQSGWVTKAGGVAAPYNTKDSTLSVSRLADTTAGLAASTNVKYVFGTVWAPASGSGSVLAAVTTNVCAYAPYNKDYSDITKLPLKSWMGSGTGSSVDHELYYCPAVTGAVSAGKSSISFALKRAYVLLRFTLSGMSTFNGVGNVSDFSIYSKNLPESNTVNITGSSAAYGTNVLLTKHRMTYSLLKGSYINKNLSTSPVIEVLLPPCTLYDATNKTLDATITVDGVQRFIRLDLTANGMSGALTGGNCYDIGVSLNPGVVAESNCYMVKPGSTIFIPVSRAVTGYLDAGGTGFPTGTSFSAGLLWSDVSASHVSALAVGQYIKVTAGGTEGNSIVYALSGGKIVWSWHIWVTSYVPTVTVKPAVPSATGGTIVLYNTRYWLDRNLGATTAGTSATAYGLFYQWGRKDPFPTTDVATAGDYPFSKNNAGPVPCVTAVNNPYKFYTNGSAPYDWSSPPKDTYWNPVSPATKTIYDPCPLGYRVPLNTEFSGVFPSNTLAGCRNGGDGALYSVGSYGYWWSCVRSGAYAFSLDSNGDMSGSVRAVGFSVRCVQE